MAATDADGDKKMIVLFSSDGKRFEVAEAAATLSHLVTNMIEGNCADGGIRLLNVTGDVLVKVVEYCNKHAAAAAVNSAASLSAAAAAEKSITEEEMKRFDTEFLEVDIVMLFDLIMAANYMIIKWPLANYMNIKCLFNLTCQRVADMMRGKSPEQMREMFGLENDFTPEDDEAEVPKENAWAFDELHHQH